MEGQCGCSSGTNVPGKVSPGTGHSVPPCSPRHIDSFRIQYISGDRKSLLRGVPSPESMSELRVPLLSRWFLTPPSQVFYLKIAQNALIEGRTCEWSQTWRVLNFSPPQPLAPSIYFAAPPTVGFRGLPGHPTAPYSTPGHARQIWARDLHCRKNNSHTEILAGSSHTPGHRADLWGQEGHNDSI